MRTVIIMLATAALLSAVEAMAQESRSEISMQGTGFFTKDMPVRARPSARRTPVAFSWRIAIT
jgi:hypothetical protein